MPRTTDGRARAVKALVFGLCLLPLFWLGARAVFGLGGGPVGGLGANPIETVNRYLGDWALRFVLLALAVTPLAALTGWGGLRRMRRMIGLFAFFYAALHVSSYVGLDQFFDLGAIAKDIAKRPYITVGMATFLMLAALAATSTDKMVRRLGGRRWRALHRLAYAAGAGGVLHFAMLVKADMTEPLLYGAILTLLLGWRLADRFVRI